MPNPICVICSTTVTSVKKPGLSCVACVKYYHTSCAGLSEEAFSDLLKNKFSWTCKKCHRRSSTLIPVIPVTPVNNSSSRSASSLQSSRAHSTSSATEQLNKVSKNSTSVDSNTVSTLPNRLQALEDKFEAKFVALEEKFTALQDNYSCALVRIASLEEELKLASSTAVTLATTSEALETKLNQVEKNLLDSNLEIQGLPQSALTDPLNALCAIGEAIGCPVEANDFESTPSRVSSKLRVTFKSKVKRRNFLHLGKAFNKEKRRLVLDGSSHRIHVNEELTSYQKNLYSQAKSFASDNNFKFVWIGLSGLIYLKKSEGCTPIIIRSPETLRSINHEDIVPKLPRVTHESPQGETSGSLQ